MVWILTFFILSIIENDKNTTGLNAIESLGHFVLFAGLSVLGIAAFIAVVIFNIIIKKN